MNARSFTLTNAGVITNDIEAVSTAKTLTIVNRGTLSGGSTALTAASYGLRTDPVTRGFSGSDQLAASFTNSGTVTGGVMLDTEATAATIVNSGTIVVRTNDTAKTPAIAINNLILGTNVVTATNSGTLISAAPGASALALVATASAAGNPVLLAPIGSSGVRAASR